MKSFSQWSLNSFILLLSQIVSRGGIFILTIIIARVLGDSVLGEFAALYAVFSILFPVAEWGQQTYLTRALVTDAKASNRHVLNSVLVCSAFAVFAAGLLFIIGSLLVVKNFEAALWLALALFFQSNSHVLKAIFRAREKWLLEANAALVDRLLMLILASAFIALGYATTGVCLAIFLGQLVSWCYVIAMLKKHFVDIEIFAKADLAPFKDHLKSGLPLMLTGLFAIVYVKSDLIILSFFCNQQEVGAYAAAYNLILISGVFSSVMLWSFFPKLAAMKKEQIVNWHNKAFLQMAVGAILLFVLLNYIREPLYYFVYASFSGVLFLPILFAAEGVNFLNYTVGVTQRALNREFVLARIMGFGALINIVLNLVLVPIVGARGAAIATLATYFTVAFFNIQAIGKNSKMHLIILVSLSLVLLLWGIFGLSMKGQI